MDLQELLERLCVEVLSQRWLVGGFATTSTLTRNARYCTRRLGNKL